MTESRLIAIESKIAYQEDLLQELNQQVYSQQRRLDEIATAQLQLLRKIERLLDHETVGLATPEKPPHY